MAVQMAQQAVMQQLGGGGGGGAGPMAQLFNDMLEGGEVRGGMGGECELAATGCTPAGPCLLRCPAEDTLLTPLPAFLQGFPLFGGDEEEEDEDEEDEWEDLEVMDSDDELPHGACTRGKAWGWQMAGAAWCKAGARRPACSGRCGRPRLFSHLQLVRPLAERCRRGCRRGRAGGD